MEERSSPFTPLEEVLTSQDGSHKRGVRIEDLVRHTMLLCGADAPPERALRGNPVRELSKAITSDKGKSKGEKGASQPHPEKSRLSLEVMVTNGNSLSTLTMRLFVAGSRSVEARMERRLEGMGRFFGYNTIHIGTDFR